MNSNKGWLEEPENRRKFILSSLLGTSVIATIGTIFPLFRYFVSGAVGFGAETVSVKIPLSEVAMGSSKFFKFKGKPAIVIRNNDNEVIAFSAVCTHLGCVVKYSESDEKFKCPCHGAQFDINGRVIAGPAPRALDKFSASIEGSKIVVEEA